MNIKVANGIKALSRKELEECFVKTLHNEHEAIYIIKKLRSWLEEQEKRSWDEVSHTFGYVLEKLNELEGGKNDKN